MVLNKIIFIAFTLLALSGNAQDTEVVKIVVLDAVYKEKRAELYLKMQIENSGPDTLTMITPQFNHFDKNFRRTPIIFNGEIKKPYTLDMQIKKACIVNEEEQMMAMIGAPNNVNLSNTELIKIAPGEKTRVFNIPLNLAHSVEICPESEIEFGVSYDPQYERLTEEQYKKINQLKEKVDALAIESNNYLEEIGWSEQEPRIRKTLLHLHLTADKTKKSLSSLKASSNSVVMKFEGRE